MNLFAKQSVTPISDSPSVADCAIALKSRLRPKEVEDEYGFKVKTLSKWRGKGTGPKFLKLGSGRTAMILYERGTLEQWLSAQAAQSTSETSTRSSAPKEKAPVARRPQAQNNSSLTVQ